MSVMGTYTAKRALKVYPIFCVALCGACASAPAPQPSLPRLECPAPDGPGGLAAGQAGRRLSPATVTLPGRYVMSLGGQVLSGADRVPACAVGEVYDIKADAWRCISPGAARWFDPLLIALPEDRVFVVGAAVDPEAYRAGGCRAGTHAAIYDVAKDQWTQLEAAPRWVDSRAGAGLLLRSDKILITSARHPDPQTVSRAELTRYARWTLLYDVKARQWSQLRESEMLVRGQGDFGQTSLFALPDGGALRVSPVGPEAVWDERRQLWILSAPKWTSLSGEPEVLVFKETDVEALPGLWLKLRRYGERWLLQRYDASHWTWSRAQVAPKYRQGQGSLWLGGDEGGLILAGGGERGMSCAREVSWVEPRLGVEVALRPLERGRQHHQLVALSASQLLVMGGVCEDPAKACGLVDLVDGRCAVVSVAPERYEVDWAQVRVSVAMALVERALKAAGSAPR